MKTEEEEIFATKDGYNTNGEIFKSLADNSWVLVGIIDCWATLLNHDEERRSDDSPHRLFCSTSVIKEGMLAKIGMTSEQRLSLLQNNMLPIVGGETDKLKLTEYDLVFFPVIVTTI